MKVTHSLAIGGLLLAMGCKGGGKSTASDTTPPAPAPIAATSSAPAVAPPRTAAKAGGCPTTVPGVAATAADTPGGVALTITAKDDASAGEVRDRAHALAQLAGQGGGRGRGGGGDGNGPGDGTGGGGAGGGGGGGGLGRCPVVLRATSLDVQDTASGAVVTMRANDARDLDFIRKQVRSRLAD